MHTSGRQHTLASRSLATESLSHRCGDQANKWTKVVYNFKEILAKVTTTCILIMCASHTTFNIAVASRGFRHAGPSIWNSLLLTLGLWTLALPSNPISKLTCCVLRAFLTTNNSIHAHLIHIFMLILALKLFYITLHSYHMLHTYVLCTLWRCFILKNPTVDLLFCASQIITSGLFHV